MDLKLFVCVLLSAVAALASASNSIIDAGVCIRDTDCDFNSYCKNSVCVPTLSLGSQCTTPGSLECSQGLYCSSTLVCSTIGGFGDPCDVDVPNSCTQNRFKYKCTGANSTCAFTGFEGDSCTRDDLCQNNLYCDSGTCTPQKDDGATCTSDEFNPSSECSGFCTGSQFLEGRVCAPYPADVATARCTSNRQCENYVSEASRSGWTCNQPLAPAAGVCARPVDIIKTLGASCDPNYDCCDAGRSLLCRWSSADENYQCMQKEPARTTFKPFCTRRTPLSTCKPDFDGAPTQCARNTAALDDFTRCNRRTEVLPRGAFCEIETYTKCARGTQCRKVPGVLVGKGFPLEARYCVKVKAVGGTCANKFTTACESGTVCEDGVCIRGDGGNAFVRSTHMYLGANCNQPPCANCNGLPCAPGLQCKDTGFFGEKRCELPVKTVGKGVGCFDTSTFTRTCKEPYVCAQNVNGFGNKICRRASKVGEFCLDDDTCMGSLKCADSTCFDPATALSLGQACTPGTVCGAPTGSFSSTQMKCLPKNGAFACQLPGELHERCDAANNVGCDDGLACTGNGICQAVA